MCKYTCVCLSSSLYHFASLCASAFMRESICICTSIACVQLYNICIFRCITILCVPEYRIIENWEADISIFPYEKFWWWEKSPPPLSCDRLIWLSPATVQSAVSSATRSQIWRMEAGVRNGFKWHLWLPHLLDPPESIIIVYYTGPVNAMITPSSPRFLVS